MQSQTRQKKQTLKTCQVCGRSLPSLWKTLTIDGNRKKCCQNCATKAEKNKKKTKEEKAKQKRKIKRERITEKKLDMIFSRLVRNIYPPVCHSTGVHLEPSGSHCAHLVSRRFRCVRWDLRNCYPTLPEENLHNQLHVIYLAKRLFEYYSITIENWDSVTKQTTIRLTEGDRKELYDVFKCGLDKVMDIRAIGKDVDNQLTKLRLEIIEKTKKIL